MTFPKRVPLLLSSFICLGDSSVTSLVMNESVAEGEEARNFLEDVQMTFPQVDFLGVIMQWKFSTLLQQQKSAKRLNVYWLLFH